MAAKKKSASKAKSKAPAKKAAAKPAARKSSSAGMGNFIKYAEKNPAVAIVGIIVVALALLLIFGA